MKIEPETFYDAFALKLINDYVRGNERMVSALQFMKAEIYATKVRRVLDIGCGIGWSSHTLAKISSVESVVAVDLSSQLLAKARLLFSDTKIRYEHLDVTRMQASALGAFDAIVMLDVYEHIPKDSRAGFHDALNVLLNPDGFLMLTCPTIDHQTHLREHNPTGLQPVDEDVGLRELTELAAHLDASLDYYQLKSIWSSRDYLHAVIRRKAGRRPISAIRTNSTSGWLRKTHVKVARLRGL